MTISDVDSQDAELPAHLNLTAYPLGEDFVVHFFETHGEALVEEMRRIKAIGLDGVIDPGN